MTEEQIKEKLSNAFVRVVANYNGYKLTVPDDTGGVDFSVTYDRIQNRGGKTRHIQSGEYVELQLKSTEEHRVIFEETHLKYDLEAKTFNDLIERFQMGNAPLVLVLAVLPDNRADWASVGDDNLNMNQKVYFFYPDDTMELTENANTIRISIPFDNKIGVDFFQNIFEEHYG